MPYHSHQPAYLSFILQGAYTESYGARTRTCEFSTVIFHPEGESHAVQFHNALTRIFRLQIEPRWLESLREYSSSFNRPGDLKGGPASDLAFRLYREFRGTETGAQLAIEGLALEIFAEFVRHGERSNEEPGIPAWLARARDILHAHFAENPSLVNIAEAVGVHPVHLARVFRKRFGSTIGDYVRRLRIEAACRELTRSDAPLVEIASALGFYDQSHFTKSFKRFIAVTPAHYRKLTRSC
jgi:AraC family transcriptional regulator